MTTRNEPVRRPVRPLPWIGVLVVLGLALAYMLPIPLVSGQSDAADGVFLPDRLDGYHLLTDSVEARPPGAALLTYMSGNSETIQTIQQITVGVDGVSYRQVNASRGANGHIRKSVFLAPDGRSILVTESFVRSREIRQLDLVTGRIRSYALASPAAVVVYAWSPDGRYVAYGQSTDDYPEALASNELALDVRDHGTLTILDLTTGLSTPHPRLGGIATAAFSPRGDRLVVQSGRRAFVIDRDGTTLHDIPIPRLGLGIVPHVAW